MHKASKSLTKKLAVICIAASFLSPIEESSATPAEPCSERVNVLAFHIQAKPDRPVYVRGEKAIIHATVTRPAHEDPAGGGNEIDPPGSQPAEDIYVGTGVHVGDDYVFGFGVTDEKGKAELEVKIDDDGDKGEADVDIYAWKDAVRTPCLTIREYGYRHYKDMFRIV